MKIIMKQVHHNSQKEQANCWTEAVRSFFQNKTEKRFSLILFPLDFGPQFGDLLGEFVVVFYIHSLKKVRKARVCLLPKKQFSVLALF